MQSIAIIPFPNFSEADFNWPIRARTYSESPMTYFLWQRSSWKTFPIDFEAISDPFSKTISHHSTSFCHTTSGLKSLKPKGGQVANRKFQNINCTNSFSAVFAST